MRKNRKVNFPHTHLWNEFNVFTFASWEIVGNVKTKHQSEGNLNFVLHLECLVVHFKHQNREFASTKYFIYSKQLKCRSVVIKPWLKELKQKVLYRNECQTECHWKERWFWIALKWIDLKVARKMKIDEITMTMVINFLTI